MNNLDDLRPLAPHSFMPDGTVAPFERQVAAYAYGEMPSGDMFVVGTDASELGLPEAGSLPVLMRQKTMRKIQADHDISLAEIENLPKWLETHPLAMESITEENALVVVADALDVHSNDIVVALHLGLTRQQIEIDEIGSVYGKNNLNYLIENTHRLGKQIFVNERTGDWILRTGLQLPEQIANRLQADYTSNRIGRQESAAVKPDLRGLAEFTVADSLANPSVIVSCFPSTEGGVNYTEVKLVHGVANIEDSGIYGTYDTVSDFLEAEYPQLATHGQLVCDEGFEFETPNDALSLLPQHGEGMAVRASGTFGHRAPNQARTPQIDRDLHRARESAKAQSESTVHRSRRPNKGIVGGKEQ